MRRIGPVCLLVTAFAGGCAPAGGGGGAATPSPTPTAPSGSKEATVIVRNFSFQPATVEIPKGGTVTWRFEDATAHNSKSTAESAFAWDSGMHRDGERFSQRFDTAGTFPYLCTPHPNMKGTVIVR